MRLLPTVMSLVVFVSRKEKEPCKQESGESDSKGFAAFVSLLSGDVLPLMANHGAVKHLFTTGKNGDFFTVARASRKKSRFFPIELFGISEQLVT